jgi:hypothetical protein
MKAEAQFFSIQPELAWLFINDIEQRKLVDCIRKLNRGFNIDELEEMQIPLDKLLQNVVVLKALLRERDK